MSRLTSALRNPVVLYSVLGISISGIALGVVGVLTRNWLVALIAVLAILLVGLVVLLSRMVLGKERDERRERGLEDDEARSTQERSEARSSAVASIQRVFQEGRAEIQQRLGDIYELPWYLVVGEPGEGKTVSLNASGLTRPPGYTHSRVFGATETVEFFLAEEAIVIDTSGRYFGGDDDEWKVVLRQLTRARPDCPINGLIFTISVASLLGKSPQDLDHLARQLRRHINEIEDVLGVDAPIYVLITKADQIEGYVEMAQGVARERLKEAFGWTNDQRHIVPGECARAAFDELADRLDRFLPELILREPNPSRRRSLFLFPDELREMGRIVAEFVGTAFRPSRYNETPFLRGIYLVSAQPEGTTVSPTLSRLGHEWARMTHDSSGGEGFFLHDLFVEIVSGDANLAIPGQRGSPIVRRLVLGAGAIVSLAAIGLFGASFVSNYQGSSSLKAHAAQVAERPRVPLKDLEALRGVIHDEATATGSLPNRWGFRQLERNVEHAQDVYVASFGEHYAQQTRGRLDRALASRGRGYVKATLDLASVCDHLAAPDEVDVELADYLPRGVRSAEAFHDGYVDYARWLRPEDRTGMAQQCNRDFGRYVADALDVRDLEDQTSRTTGQYAGLSYPPRLRDRVEFGGMIAGIYTVAGFQGVIARLLAAVERDDEDMPPVSPAKLRRFKTVFADRFDAKWREYLLGVPEGLQQDRDVTGSPYLEVIEQVASNTSLDVPRSGPAPRWMEALQAMRSPGLPRDAADLDVPDLDQGIGGLGRGGGAADAGGPWSDYRAALEAVAAEVREAVDHAPTALKLSRRVAQGEPNEFQDALRSVRDLLPPEARNAETRKLETLLSLPVLNGLLAVLRTAQGELDLEWRERIVEPYGGRLGPHELQGLYEPRTGDLARFEQEVLSLFYTGTGPKDVLGSVQLPLGPSFRAWMENAREVQRTLGTGGLSGRTRSVQLRGVPSDVFDRSGFRVKRRDLRMECGSGIQTFTYREGRGSESFDWDATCSSVSLRVVLGRAGEDSERYISRRWEGPLAFLEFLQEAKPAGNDVLEWTLRDGDTEVIARYALGTGQDLLNTRHLVPPPSLGS